MLLEMLTICFKRVYPRFKNQGPVALHDLGSSIEMSSRWDFCSWENYILKWMLIIQIIINPEGMKR
jgi:hypothetical protein